MRDNGAEAIALFREELRLCGVGSGQTVAVLAPADSMRDRADGFLAAARELGADAFVLTLPGARTELYGVGATPLTGRPAAIELLKTADLIVDFVLLLFSPEQIELQEAGCRILLCVEPLPILKQLMPNAALRERVEAAADRARSASELRVTSAAGTDVTYTLGAYPVVTEYGYTDEPGRWDHWPSGFVFTHGSDDDTEGTVVLNTGDVLLLPVRRFVETPVRLTIEKGYVVELAGEGLDAMLVRDFLPDPEEGRDAWAVSHIGWGLNNAARWAPYGVPGDFGMNQRSFAGNVQFSTGPNTELGGTRATPYHLDIPMRGCSLYLDGDLVVDTGKLVEPIVA
jgi:2,5-dihydroxypyridine 5,6-dioxygenase